MTPPAIMTETHGSSNRVFGWVFGVIFAIIGLLPFAHRAAPRVWALVLSGLCGVLAVVFPQALAGPNRLWTRFGLLLHAVTNPVALFLIYVLAVAPMGLLMRLLGKDLLSLSYNEGSRSYWIIRDPPGRSDTGLKNQY